MRTPRGSPPDQTTHVRFYSPVNPPPSAVSFKVSILLFHFAPVTTFKFPPGRKLRTVGCTTKEEPDNPTELDGEGERCFIVG